MASKPQAPEVCVKQELDWDEETSGDELRAQGPASAQHVYLKEELVQHLKEEAEWEDKVLDGVSESAALVDLYAGHQVKDELVLGPEGPQPRDVAFTLYAAQALIVKEKPVLKDCVVRLERIDHLSTAGRASRLNSHVENNVDTLNKIHTSTTIEATENYVCDICKKRYTLKTQLMEHVMIHIHQSVEQDESVCGVPDNDEPRVKRKSEKISFIENQTTQYKLEIMPTPIHNDQANRAEMTHETNVTLMCQICHTTYDSQQDLAGHMGVHDKRKTVSKKRGRNVGEIYICNNCGKEFSRRDNFIRHIESHEGVRQFTCNVCGRRFRHKSYLTLHMLIHTGEKPYSCDICNKQFRQKSALNVHKRIHTGEKPFRCDICNKRFAQISGLYMHQRIHAEKKAYTCDICDKEFRQKVNLKAHNRTHTGEKPFSCDTCHKQFAEQSSLKRHMRIHTGEKPYTCETCNLKFRELSSYNRHKITHTGQKPYACDVCNSNFGRKSHLNRHKQVHTGEKPFCCKICGKRYTERFTLNTHKQTH